LSESVEENPPPSIRFSLRPVYPTFRSPLTDEHAFLITFALHPSVPTKLRLVAGMADQVACVRPFRDDLMDVAITLENLLLQADARVRASPAV
jgi:hypothetical protein